jgi:hypothetical protein
MSILVARHRPFGVTLFLLAARSMIWLAVVIGAAALLR